MPVGCQTGHDDPRDADPRLPGMGSPPEIGDTVVAAAGEDEFVRLYDLASGDRIGEKAAHRDWIRCLAFGGDMLVTGSGDSSARVWKVSGGELTLLRTIETGAPVRAVAVTDSGDLIVTAGEDATLRAYTADALTAEQPLPAGIDWIRASPCDRTVRSSPHARTGVSAPGTAARCRSSAREPIRPGRRHSPTARC